MPPGPTPNAQEVFGAFFQKEQALLLEKGSKNFFPLGFRLAGWVAGPPGITGDRCKYVIFSE
jgi:hypothetical protein